MTTTMSIHECAGRAPVEFILNDDRRVSIADESLRHEQVGAKRVVWDDGSESWAKTWWWSANGKAPGECCRIGAGAHGDYIVVRFQ